MKRFNIKFVIILVAIFLFAAAFSVQAEISKISEFSATEGIGRIELMWQIGNLDEAESFILLRKENSCPKFYGDGREIYRGNGEEYADLEPGKGKKYCYGAYIYDFSGRISEIKTTGLVERLGLAKYLANFLVSENNYFLAGEIVVFLALFWINWKRKRGLEKEGRLRVIRMSNVD